MNTSSQPHDLVHDHTSQAILMGLALLWLALFLSLGTEICGAAGAEAFPLGQPVLRF